jgi:hypothetical protein
MKKSIIILAATFLLTCNLFAQNGKSRTMVTSLDYHAENTVLFDLNGKVDIKEWEKNYIRVVASITTNLQNEGTLDVIAGSDRYFVDTREDRFQRVTITNPYMDKIITINGKPLREQIQYEVYVPHYTPVQVLRPRDKELLERF